MVRAASQMTLLYLLAILLPTTAAAGEAWGPWQKPEAPSTLAAPPSGPPGILRSGVRFFQKFISPVDGPRCPMYPTCSSYALQALDTHGPLLGTLLTVDRILHENAPEERDRPIRIGRRLRYHDPLAHNDFWLDKSSDKTLP